jgi:FtsX-like permease family
VRAAGLWAGVEIRRRIGALALLALLVALAVGSTLALVAGARQAGSAFDRYLRRVDPPDVLISLGQEPSAELLTSLQADPRVTSLDRSELVVMWPAPAPPSDDAFTVIAETPDAGFGRPAVVAGRFYRPDAPDEIVVNERAAATYGYHAGQRVTLQQLPCFDGCPVEPVGDATIVGIVRLATDLTEDPTVPGVVFASTNLLGGAWRDVIHAASLVGVHLDDRRDAPAVIAGLSPKISDGDVEGTLSVVQVIDRSGRLQHNALLVAAAVVAVAGLLVVAQAAARHLSGRSLDGSVLAALGMRPAERRAGAVASLAPALVAGVALGAGLAVVASGLLPLGLVRRADPSVGVHIDGAVLGLGALLFLAALLGVTAVMATRWVRPARGVAATRSGTHVALAAHLRPVPATGSRFALQRGDGRTRLPVVATVVVLGLTTATAVGALVVRWSLDGLVSTPARFGQGWDLRVGARDDVEAAGARLEADPRVRDVAVGSAGEINVTRRDGAIVQISTTGLDSLDGPLPLTVISGRAPAGPREIALGPSTMAELGLGVGDRTVVSGPCGSLDADVVGRVALPLTGDNYPDAGSIVTLGTFRQVCAAELLADIDAEDFVLVRTRTGAAAAALGEDVTARGSYARPLAKPIAIASLEDIGTVPVVVAVLVAILGAAVAAHALSLAVRRRRGDLAVLRTFGLTPRQAGGVIRWQAVVLAAVALAIGIPAGLVVGRLVWSAIAEPSDVVVRADVSSIGLLVFAALAVAVALVLSIRPAHRAAHLRPAETLRSE